MLVTLWTTDPGRFTRDIDFLAFCETEDATLTSIFAEILSLNAGDGLEFSIDTITTTDIREDQVYGGKRLRTVAHLGKTEIPITIDLGFGDALPDPNYEIEYGSILDFEPARIRAYSTATVIAEKFQAVVALGPINGRMKDFYDLWAIPKATEIDPADLRAAIAATFERRNTPVPTEAPQGLSAAFAEDPAKGQAMADLRRRHGTQRRSAGHGRGRYLDLSESSPRHKLRSPGQRRRKKSVVSSSCFLKRLYGSRTVHLTRPDQATPGRPSVDAPTLMPRSRPERTIKREPKGLRPKTGRRVDVVFNKLSLV